jgi:hypothetical protein
MRLAVIPLLLFLLAGCASSGGYAEPALNNCADSSELSVEAYLNLPKIMMEQTSDALTMVVELGNNSNHDIEVKSIRVEPGRTAQHRYSFESGFITVNEVLKDGEDKRYEIPIRGTAGFRETQMPLDSKIEVVLTVSLADGTTYRCQYDVEAPR